MATTRELVKCPVCGGHYLLDKNGKIAAHGWNATYQGGGYRSKECIGGRQLAAGASVGTKEVKAASEKVVHAAIGIKDRFRDDKGRLVEVQSAQGSQSFMCFVQTDAGVMRKKFSLAQLRSFERVAKK